MIFEEGVKLRCNLTTDDAEKILLLHPELHWFEYEIPCADKTKKHGNHLICLLTFDELMIEVMKPRPRLWHEKIYAGRPCVFYMDIEKEEDDWVVDEDLCVQYVHQLIIEKLEFDIPLPTKVRNSRPKKFSIHLFWNICMPNPESVLDIVRTFPEHQGVDFDKSVYPTESTHLLRMPWSGKLDGTPPLIPDGCTLVFDPIVFCRCLVGFNTKDSKRWGAHLPIFPIERNINISNKRQRKISTKNHTIPELKAMEMSIPGFAPIENLTESEDGDGTWMCFTRMHCECARRWHSSNRTKITGNLNGSISIICLRAECNWYTYHLSRAELALSQMPIELN